MLTTMLGTEQSVYFGTTRIYLWHLSTATPMLSTRILVGFHTRLAGLLGKKVTLLLGIIYLQYYVLKDHFFSLHSFAAFLKQKRIYLLCAFISRCYMG